MSEKIVLVVEDDIDLSEMIALGLGKLNCRVETVCDGAEALFWLSRNLPKVVILDLKMPFVSGSQVLKYVRSCPELAGVKVVVVTVYDPQDAHSVHELADYFFQKPYPLAQFRAVVEDFLQSA